MGTSRRYADSVDRQMNKRIIERTIGGGRPASLTDEELELDRQPITRIPIPRQIRVWLRYSTGPVLVDAEAVARTEHAVAIQWTTSGGDEHRAWVWAGAVRGRLSGIIDSMSQSSFIHHIAVCSSDFKASEAMFTAALRELGIEAQHRTDTVAEYWDLEHDAIALSLEARTAHTVTTGLHIAFAAPDRDSVDRFHDAFVQAGGRSKHSPRHWPEYRAYCAFLRDPDGNNIEVLHKEVG